MTKNTKITKVSKNKQKLKEEEARQITYIEPIENVKSAPKGGKRKLKEEEIEEIRSQAVKNTLTHIINTSDDKNIKASDLIAKTSLLINTSEVRRMALLMSKETLGEGYSETSQDRGAFKDGKNPSKEVLALFKSGLYLRKVSRKELCYFTCEEIGPIIEDYFVLCAEEKLPLSVPGLATYLGVSTKQLLALADGAENNEFSDLLQYALTAIQAQKSDLADEGYTKPSTYIFNSKNYFGMKDTSEKKVEIKRFGDGAKQREIIDALPDSDD